VAAGRAAAIAVAVLAAVLAGALFFWRGVSATSPAVREQARVVFAGLLAGVVLFIPGALGAAIPTGWLLVSTLLFPASVAYTVSQYSVLTTSRFARDAATVGVLAAAVSLGYALIVAGLNAVLSGVLEAPLSATNPVLVSLLAFGIALGLDPLRRRLRAALDTRLLRTQGNYQARLTDFRHQLTLAAGLGEVVRLIKQQIREGLIPTHTYVFLRDPLTGDFEARGEGSRPDTGVRFEPGSGLVHALSTTRDVLFLEPNKPLPPELVQDHARLAILRTPVLVALQGQDRLAGWIAIGPKRSGEPFTVEDLRYVQAVAEQASLAVERAQVITDLERRVRELDVLSQVAQAVNFTTDPDVLFELIYAQTSKLIDTTNFYILMHDPDARRLRYVFFLENNERIETREGEEWPDDEGLASEIIRTGRPIRTADYRAECERRGLTPRPERHYAWMGVPLNTGSRTGGVMIVASYEPGVLFAEDQLKVFWAIADQAATALDKARLFNETEARARQLATLNDIAKELSSTLDLPTLLERIMRAAVDIIGVEAGSLLLLDEETGELVFRTVAGGEQELVGTRLPLGVGVVSEAIESKQPVIVNNVVKDPRWHTGMGGGKRFHTHALLAVPLLIQDESIGALELINRRDGAPFDEDDAALLTTFAAQAAVAIENARLYEKTDAELARRVDELQNMQRVDRELNRTLELDQVVQTTLDWAMRLTGADAGMIALLADDGAGLNILTSRGYDEARLAPYTERPLPLDSGIAGRALHSGQPEFVEQTDRDPDYVQLTARPAAAQITVPILLAGQPSGVLVLEAETPGMLTPADFDFAQRLVEHAAVAIQNARLVQEVRDANRSKTEFISFVAHELKNPMTSIRGYTDLLRGGQVGPVTDMQVQFLTTIRNNVDRMTRLVSDLSDMARIETGHMRFDMENISVEDIVQDTLSALQGQIEEKGQQLTLAVEPGLPPIYADYTRMVQVLTNLVSNAHKYTPEGGAIEVGAQLVEWEDEETGQARPVIHHWVRDTGIGMSEEELGQLFSKFFRSQAAKEMAPGTGLGLHITRGLIAEHGGQIWVESTPGEGSVFHYIIPVAEGDTA
ncbi:MAG: GAF domain-containing protein, partial [Aggregatilineales bacterium]